MNRKGLSHLPRRRAPQRRQIIYLWYPLPPYHHHPHLPIVQVDVNPTVHDTKCLAPLECQHGGNHTSNIFAKLQAVDRVQAIIRAREAGLGGEEGR